MEIIDTTNIYNDVAKSYEREYYTDAYLSHLIQDDPESVVASFDDNVLTSFAISRRDNGPWWLSWFAVAPAHRGKGLGKRVLATILDTLPKRGIHKLWCDTRVNNQYSINILVELGFNRLCRVENHWCNQDYFLWEWRTPILFEQTRQND
jgi:ribosomal protein S18 acetylase RimI-like enzyme